jgi:DNA-binding IclR family transcriptional regulator
VAAVLGGTGGEVVGAVGLVVPATEWPVPVAAVDALRAAARAVSRELGATAWPPPAAGSLGASA